MGDWFDVLRLFGWTALLVWMIVTYRRSETGRGVKLRRPGLLIVGMTLIGVLIAVSAIEVVLDLTG